MYGDEIPSPGQNVGGSGGGGIIGLVAGLGWRINMAVMRVIIWRRINDWDIRWGASRGERARRGALF
jgi:tRNA(Ile2) C34 agmatinyltransferase TiaS